METIWQLYEMFGGLRVLLQVAGVQMLNQSLQHRMRRMHTNWSKVAPEKQLENMPQNIKDLLIGTATKQAVVQGKQYYMGYRNRKLGTLVHSKALEKVMHGSVNEYFDVTPIGRVIRKFDDEINVFRGGMLGNVQEIFNIVFQAIFQFGFLISVSWWSLVVLFLILVYSSRLHFFWRRAQRKLQNVYRT